MAGVGGEHRARSLSPETEPVYLRPAGGWKHRPPARTKLTTPKSQRQRSRPGRHRLVGGESRELNRMSTILSAATAARQIKALAPEVRVNCINPGPVLMPEDYGEELRQKAVARTLLGREGSAADIARSVRFLLEGSDYITGAVLPVDGGLPEAFPR